MSLYDSEESARKERWRNFPRPWLRRFLWAALWFFLGMLVPGELPR